MPARQEGGDQAALVFLRDVTADGRRVTFAFGERDAQPVSIPRWIVEPAAPPLTADPSGEPIEIAGTSFLRVTIWASGYDMERGRPVYTGPKTITPAGSGILRQLRHAGDFENVVTWYAGLGEPACALVDARREALEITIDLRG